MPKILIVDDSPVVRTQVSKLLTDSGFEVAQAADGLEGSASIRENADIALVLCDVNMPRQGGLEMLSSLQTELAERHLPVVMLTTEGDPQMIAQARKSGACGWLVKPFKDNILLSVCNKLTQANQ